MAYMPDLVDRHLGGEVNFAFRVVKDDDEASDGWLGLPAGEYFQGQWVKHST
jgi:hypothetical protein